MEFCTIPVGRLQTNCYLVWDTNGEAVLIDPGDEPARILAEVTARHLQVKAVLLTHLHIDHFAAVPAILAQTGTQLIVPQEEEAALHDGGRSLMNWLAPVERFTLQPDRLVGEGDTVTVGSLTFAVWHTPGHTAGSSCFVCEDALFCGDTLFAGSAGRTDLPSGDSAALHQSLMRLAAHPQNLRVLPGHGEASTLDTERRFNPFMK